MPWPTKVNLKIFQGSTYSHRFIVQKEGVSLPLTGYTARMHIRQTVASDTILYQTTEAGDLDIDEANGWIDLEIHGDVSELWTFTSGVYDIEIETPGGKPYRIAEGSVKVDPEVTRP